MQDALVIDTSAILAILLEEPEVVLFANILLATPSLCIAAPTLLEASIVINTRRGEVGVTGLKQLMVRLNVEAVPCAAQHA